MRNRYHRLLLSCLILSGCGDGRPETYPVHGRVTWNGAPVTAGRITFHPTEGRPALSSIESDGSYQLTTFEPGDGALAGSHQVTILAMESSGEGGNQDPTAEGAEVTYRIGGVKWVVPQEYARETSTPLTAEVDVQSNTIDFDLP